MKKYLFLFLVLLFIFPARKAFASEVSITAASFVPIRAAFNGTEIKLSNDPLAGVILSDGEEQSLVHYMSLKGVLEQIGYIVNFDSSNNIVNIVTAENSENEYVPGISTTSIFASGGVRGAVFNGHIVKINGTELDLGDEKVISLLRGTEAHPQYFLPMRPVLEALGYTVGWDDVNETITIEE